MFKSNLWNIDFSLILPVFILQILSLITLFSVDLGLFRNQLIFSAISVLAFLFFSQTNYKVLQFYAKPIYLVSVVLLLLVLALGIESRGAVRWIEILGFRIQFSEMLKPFLALSLASYLMDSKTSLSSFVKISGFLLFIVFLIFLQPDLGSAVIYFTVALLSIIFFGFPLKYFVSAFIIFAAFLPLSWKFLHGYQKERLLTFINPAKDPLGTSYNAIQSIIAVGSGMFIGKGLGHGTQSSLSFLPERHTDFIFATISEQLGFVGSLMIVLSFAFLLWRIYDIFRSSKETFPRVFAACSFFLILIQFFVNIGMNIGVLPVVGVTLPFVSYGGSSLLSNFILLGLLSSIQKQAYERRVLEIG